MNEVFQAALEIQHFLDSQGWSFCIISGLAVVRWGEPRMTQGVDVSLLTDFGEEEPYITELLSVFQPRIPHADTFALRNRVLLMTASNGTPVDISFAGLPFEQTMMARATHFAYLPDCSLLTCSVEDLLVLKAFADRTRDWMDVKSILVRQSESLDTTYILEHLTPLCDLKEAPEIVTKLQKLMYA